MVRVFLPALGSDEIAAGSLVQEIETLQTLSASTVASAEVALRCQVSHTNILFPLQLLIQDTWSPSSAHNGRASPGKVCHQREIRAQIKVPRRCCKTNITFTDFRRAKIRQQSDFIRRATVHSLVVFSVLLLSPRHLPAAAPPPSLPPHTQNHRPILHVTFSPAQ